LIDGRAAARAVRAELQERVVRLRERGTVPGLGILLVGDFAPSHVYVRSKEKACAATGIDVDTVRLPANATRDEMAAAVARWNQDRAVHGMIVQLPLPGGIESNDLIDLIDPDKDADGLTPVSLGRLLAGRPRFVPATPAGIVELLVRYQIPISGAHVVIVGRGALVGRPLASLLLQRGARADSTVTVCHSRSRGLADLCRSAEILVVAAGRAGLVSGEMVSDGVVVIDAGTNRTEKGLVGDVDFESVAARARAITPVPGGVGPMTVAMLLANLVRAAELQTGLG